MQINIRLPRPVDIGDQKVDTSYEAVKGFLKQLELSVHHAQKSLEEMVKMEKERGKQDPSLNVIYRLHNVEDSGTGDRFDSEHPYTDDIEIEIYTD